MLQEMKYIVRVDCYKNVDERRITKPN